MLDSTRKLEDAKTKGLLLNVIVTTRTGMVGCKGTECVLQGVTGSRSPFPALARKDDSQSRLSSQPLRFTPLQPWTAHGRLDALA